MRNGEKSPGLLAWLNSLPAAKEVLGAEFEGSELNGDNLSRRRRGGYQDWLAEEQTKEAAVALANHAAALQGVSLGTLTQNMALVTIARLGCN